MSDVEELRAEIARLRGDLNRLESALESATQDDGEPDRRRFFRLAAGAAAGAVVAVAASANPAAAANTDPWLVGTGTLGDFSGSAPSNTNSPTQIFCPSSNTLMPIMVSASNISSDGPGVNTRFRVALLGRSAGADPVTNCHRVGVMGVGAPGAVSPDDRNIGVYGAANFTSGIFPSQPVGVFGTAGANGRGVQGYAETTNAIGVHGLAALDGSSTGVLAESSAGGTALRATTTGLAVDIAGSGRMRQALRGAIGAPTGVALIGEQARDSNGDLFVCVGSGNPGTWRKVVAQHPNFAASGGSINLFTNPIRLVDTRGNGAPLQNGGLRLAPNTDVTFQVTGTLAGGVGVPSGAAGIIGNVTAVDPNNGGNLSVFPNAFANTSNINYVPNQTSANAFTSALSSTGQIRVRSSVATTHFLMDISGFLF